MLAALCLVIPILPSYVTLAGSPQLSPARIISLVLLGLFVLGFLFGDGTGRKIHFGSAGFPIILAYFILAAIPFTVEAPISDITVFVPHKAGQFTLLLETMGIVLYTIARIGTTRQRSILLGILAVALTYLCMVGILQNYFDIDLRLLFRPPGFREMHEVGQTVNVATQERFGAKRAFATSDHAAEFAVLASVTVPLTLHFARFAERKLTRQLAVVSTAVALIGMLAAASRSGLVAIAAALVFYVWSLKVRETAAVIVGGALLAGGIAAVAAGEAIVGSVRGLATAVTQGLSLEDVSVAVRVQRYMGVSKVFHDHPFFGLGIGRLPPGMTVLDNQWLKALVEGGLVGLAALILFSVGGMFGIALALRRATTPRQRDQVYAVGALFIGITAASYTFDLLMFKQVTLIWFLSFGLLWSLSNPRDPEYQSS
jgi:hypothetical protein